MRSEFETADFGPANFVPLSPVSFLKRASLVYARKPATSYLGLTRSWAEVADRVRAIAAALSARGIGIGDTVSVLSPNRPELFELHFAVPLVGAVLNTINTRLECETVAYILSHSDAKLVFADPALADLLKEAFAQNSKTLPVIDMPRTGMHGFGQTSYDALTDTPPHPWSLPQDEGQALALNYTSGTSGKPKGVIYHHRGAYLMALGTVAAWSLPQNPTYLSVVPMFHCNGWNHPWAMAIVGAHMIFAEDMAAETLLKAMAEHRVTHLGAAPVILQMLAESGGGPAKPFAPPIKVMTAGAPPPPSVLEKAAALGLEIMQVYGLTETYGHISQCLWQDAWADLPASERAEKQAMQGVALPMLEDLRVIDRQTGKDVASDGATQGEIAIRGNTVMKGYYKDTQATEAAFKDGWFWSGDGAVVHPDRYVQIRDRLKDVIISGGENISSVEVEAVLYRHPAIASAAVVARPHTRWGEAPCAFVELRPGMHAADEEIIAFCRQRLAGFKAPKTVIFQDLPKTATGKIQKYILRDIALSLGDPDQP